ncbi:MAG: hypothetical protein II185_07945, partial [Firmicutes bacterium]|nr:hypothetical protein [Bacillota bacterium]
AWDETVLVKDAWDEQVPITQEVAKIRCECGALFDSSSEWKAHDKQYWDTAEEDNHDSYSNIHVTVTTGYNTVHHDAEYKTVHHEAEYKTVHHDAEYKTVHHEAKTEQVKVVDKKAWDEKVLVKDAWTETKTTPAWDEKVLVKDAWDEQVLVKDAYDETVPAHDEQELVKEAYDEVVKEAWDEEVVTGQKCKECGETKQLNK